MNLQISNKKAHSVACTGRSAYAWALSIVSAYAFTLGDDQFQGLVPMWDMLNHVTGQVNVRLHHDQANGALQMIATHDIAQGWWEKITKGGSVIGLMIPMIFIMCNPYLHAVAMPNSHTTPKNHHPLHM